MPNKQIAHSEWFTLPAFHGEKLAKPGFIWEGALTQQDVDHLNSCLSLYDQLMVKNAAESEARMSEEDWRDACQPFGWKDMPNEERQKWMQDYEKNPEEYKDRFRGQMAALKSTNIPSKSALLWRLLCKKRAFKQPPPTAHSYPFYSVLQNDCTRDVFVSLGGAMPMGSLMNGDRGAPGDFNINGVEHLVINHSVYRITDANDAGKALLAAALDLVTSSSSDAGIARNHPAWDRLKETYSLQPEITIKHGGWPAWILKMERSEPRYYLERYFRLIQNEDPFFSVKHLDPLDLTTAHLGIQIEVPVESDGEDAEEPKEEQDAKRILDSLKGEYEGSRPEAPPIQFNPGSLAASFCGAGSESAMAPDDQRECYASTMRWAMHKSPEWKLLSDSDLYFE